MDALDLRILDILQTHGRATQAEIAKTVGLSPPAVGERMRKLESNGVLRRYVALVNAERVRHPITAFVGLSIDKPIHVKGFLQRVKELDSVLECHHVAGDMDYWLKVRARSTSALEHLLNHDLRSMDGVGAVKTIVVLSAAKEETRLKLTLEDLEP